MLNNNPQKVVKRIEILNRELMLEGHDDPVQEAQRGGIEHNVINIQKEVQCHYHIGR